MKEGFCVRVDLEEREEFIKNIVMNPLKVSVGLKRLLCRMSGATKEAFGVYNVVFDRIRARYLVQLFLTYEVFPTQIG